MALQAPILSAPPAGQEQRQAIHVDHLARRFDTLTAVDDLSFSVAPGEIFGFLGPNGAGKSTTIKMLCTLLRPSSGSASVNGYDVVRDPARVRASLGIIFQEYSLDDRITAEENLRFHCMIYHVPRRERSERIRRMLEMVDLTDRASHRVRTFSGGMRRRLEIARGLLHQPAVLFLDEPTVGLDPQTRQTIWEHIHALRRQEGITVFMTTHYLDEAEHCDRIGIMDHARLVALDSPAALKAASGGDVVWLRTADNAAASRYAGALEGVTVSEEDGKLRLVMAHAAEVVPDLLRRIPVSVFSVEITQPTLNDVFLKLTGRTIREEGAGNEGLRSQLRKRGGRA